MINAAGAALITKSESIRLKAYLCPAGVPTIGRGHTHGITLQMVKDGYTITPAQEQELFNQDMMEWERDVRACLKRDPNENQLAAMISLAFNIGIPRFKTSSVLKAYDRGDYQAAARAFGLWNKITDPRTKQLVVSNGLSIRRSLESALFLTVVQATESYPSINEPMPQEVVEPKPMTASTINRSAAIAGGTATVAMATETVNTITSLKYSISGLGDWLVPLLLVVTVAAVGYIIWERHNQRKNGSA